MMPRRIGHRSLAEPGHLRMHQAFQEGELSGVAKNLATNPTPIRHTIRAQCFPTPARNELKDDVRANQNRARQLVGIDDLKPQARKHG